MTDGAGTQSPGLLLSGEQRRDSQLHRRRDQLAEEVAELQWNLGGLAYEMAIRDHFRLDVLIRRAAMLQERDAELAEVERMLHMQESGSAGDCPSCGAVRSRGAVFCWQCGAQVMELAGTSANGHRDAPHPIDALVGAGEPDIHSESRPEPVSWQDAPSEDVSPAEDLGRPVQTSS
jgi:hypothetical protein